MNYHNITHDDMKNGDGLRVVLWVAGCGHQCPGCHNPITWAADGGIPFDETALEEICSQMAQPHISGLTISGGDPLYPENRQTVFELCKNLKQRYPQKTIWLYTGYLWEEISGLTGISDLDVVIDGRFIQERMDINYPWAGSGNQRVIDVKKTLEDGKNVVLLNPAL